MKKQTIITSIVVLIIVVIAVVGYMHYKNTPLPATTTNPTNNTITIQTEHIDEANYSGTKPVIIGSGALADAARTYITESIATFAAQADKEVPGMREKFGNDAPPSHYTIDINAKEIDSATTQSIVIDSYVYMGGANGSSLYKAFTLQKSTGALVSINDVVQPAKQSSFIPFIQKQLLTWRPEGTTESVVFADEIKDLTLNSFSNFSLDDKNLTIYFDKYQIGPGALGAVAFPVSLTAAKDYLVTLQ